MTFDRILGARAARIFSLAVLSFFVFPASPQTTNAPQAPPPAQSHGTVIFSRSTDESGQTTTAVGPAGHPAFGQSVSAPVANDAERQSLTFTSFDLDVHLRAAEHAISVRAIVAVRNDGKSPLAHIPLQITSSLNWERIRIAGHDAAFTVATLNSDVDHTGQLREAAVTPAAPLAPGSSLNLDVTYSGTIAQTAQRLLAIGTPEDVALHSDWDSIGVDFTGLRGFANVVWYPASSVPVILGDGARVFDEMGEHKQRISGARFRLRLTSEFPHGNPPTAALINGHNVPLTITDSPTSGADVSGIATAAFDTPALGFEAPSLFVAIRTPHQAANATFFASPSDEANVPNWSQAADSVTPFLEHWFGQSPRSRLTILDLPDPRDSPFETGALLVTTIRQAAHGELSGILLHALAQAWMSSPRAWLSEGVAHFMDTLWIEKQSGREKSLDLLESSRAALALAEPPSPGESPGQPLAQATSPVYYRTKAAYVFWMLRDIVGDPALSAALRAYSAADDAARGLGPMSSSAYFEELILRATTQFGENRDLSWFFSDWISNDKGLPDIAIDSVFPSPSAGPPPPTPHSSKSSSSLEPGNNPTLTGPDSSSWLVAVNLSNSGYAAAEIPVTVRNASTSVTQRIIVPARGKATVRILIDGRPTEVQANDGAVPETQASIHIKTLSDADSGTPSSSTSPSTQ